MSTDVLEERRERIDALADEIATLAATLDATTHRLMVAIRAFDEERGWALQGAKTCAQWLTWRTGQGAHAAREWVRVAKALGELPKMDAALEKGAVSFTKVRAMTRVATPENEELLLAQAETATGSQLERVCAELRGVIDNLVPERKEDRRRVRRRHRRDGMVVIEARLWPDEAEMVMQALRATQATLRSLQTPPLDEPCPFGAHPSTDVTAETPDGESEPSPAPPPSATEPSSDVTAETSSEAKPSEPLVAPPSANLADALVAMAERQLVTLATTGGRGDQTPSPPAAARRELLVHLRHSDIREDTWSAELHDGTLIAGETLYRLACDSGLVVARTDDEGDPLDVGRRRRRVSAALLKALWIRDRGCRFPGCRQRVFVESHHIDHWARGGPTTKANLLLLCHRHHRAVHEDGFTVRRDDEGHPCFYDPDGRRIPDYPVAASPSDAAPVDDPRINLIRWDGRRADIRRAVEALTRRFLRGKSP